MPRIVGDRTFTDERIEVDGISFRDCFFQGCTFIFRGTAPFALVRCSTQSTRMEMAGAAAETISMLRELYDHGFTREVDAVVDSVRAPRAGARH